MLNTVLAISVGAAIGALSRWALSNSLNMLFPMLPPGTLAANLIGAYLVGVAAAVFVLHPDISVAWRSFCAAGLSCCCLPFARPICSLARPAFQYSSSGTIV